MSNTRIYAVAPDSISMEPGLNSHPRIRNIQVELRDFGELADLIQRKVNEFYYMRGPLRFVVVDLVSYLTLREKEAERIGGVEILCGHMESKEPTITLVGTWDHTLRTLKGK